jgi:hypothetical protein
MVALNFERTRDALRFLHAKRARHEVDLAALLRHPTARTVAAQHAEPAMVVRALVDERMTNCGARSARIRRPGAATTALVPSIAG